MLWIPFEVCLWVSIVIHAYFYGQVPHCFGGLLGMIYVRLSFGGNGILVWRFMQLFWFLLKYSGLDVSAKTNENCVMITYVFLHM